MARIKQSQRPAVPRTATSRGGRPTSKPALAGLVASILAITWALAMLTPAGQVLYVYMYYFVEFYAGVVTLVSLSLTVMAGVLATDRIVLMIRHRVLLQSVHRSTGMIAMISLGLHIVLKISEGHADALDTVLPFVSGRGFYIGMGTLAAYLMVAVLWTGIIRARFVGVGKPWMWRAMHSTAYASWPIALLHGLNAGRAPAAWVTLSYLLCVFLVIVALLVRLTVSLGRKRNDQGQTTATMKPVGKLGKDEAESRGGRAGASRRRASEDIMVSRRTRDSFGAGRPDPVVDSWSRPGEVGTAYSPQRGSDRFVVPEVARARADDDRVFAGDDPPEERWSAREPVSARDGGRRGPAEDYDELYRPRRRTDDPTADQARDERSAQSRRWAADDRSAEGDLGDGYRESFRESYRETSRETAQERSRRRLADDERMAARDRFGRHSLDEDDYAPRRTTEDDDYPPRRTVEDDYPPRREIDDYRYRRAPEEEYASRRAPEEEYASRRAPEDDYPSRRVVEEPRVTARYTVDSEVPVDDTPTLVDLASRRAIRAAATEASNRSSRRKRSGADNADEAYWRELRGEAK